MDIAKLLNEYINPDYAAFQRKICQTDYPILGIKIPNLRKISKQLLKEYNYQEILTNLKSNSFEEIMLEGLIISNATTSYAEKIKLITTFLPKIDNWAVCDIFCGELKIVKKYPQEFLQYLESLQKINQEYYNRFIIVILLNYYINDDYLDYVLNKMLEFKSDDYYVKMAIAWCLSICLVKYFTYTLKFMQENQNNLEKWTYNKALQKGRESLRLTKEQKELLKNAKIN